MPAVVNNKAGSRHADLYSFGGNLTAGRRPDGGFSVVARLPLIGLDKRRVGGREAMLRAEPLGRAQQRRGVCLVLQQ